MTALSHPASGDEAGRPRKPWSAMKIMLAILGALVAINVAGHLLFPAPDQAKAAAAYPLQPAATARADALAFHRQISQVTVHCEFESAVLSVAMMGSDPVSGYQAAKNVEAACTGMSDKLSGLTIPQSVGREVAQAYAGALQQCKSAYLDRWSVANSLEAALDTGGKVSALADLRRNMGDWKETSRACDAALSGAPAPLGLTQDDLADALRDGGTAQPVAPTTTSSGAAPVANYMGHASPAELVLLRKHADLSADCQDGGQDGVCAARDRVDEQLTRQGWCYARPGDDGTDHTWHHCHEANLRQLPERQAIWLTQCEQALARDVPQPTRFLWPQPDAASEVIFNQRPGPPRDTKAPDVVLSFLVRLAGAPGHPVAGFATCGFKDNYDADGGVSLVSHRI